MKYDRQYLVWALGYLVLGMALGIYMSVSHDHAQAGTHTHLLLVGSVVSFLYGVTHKLWLAEGQPSLARIQFLLHQGGTLLMMTALALLLGKAATGPQAGPFIALGALAIILSALLMLKMVLRSEKA